MCDQCQEINVKIRRYLMLATRVTDYRTLLGIHDLIHNLEREKAALHA